MKLKHTHTTDTPLDVVWSHFMDLRRVGSCFPGGAVTEVDGDAFKGQVKVGLGLFKLTFVGEGRLVTKDDKTHHGVIRSTGSESHGIGRASIDIDLRLREEGGRTRMDLTTDLDVKGLPTRIGQGIAQRVSGPLVRQFLECMGRP